MYNYNYKAIPKDEYFQIRSEMLLRCEKFSNRLVLRIEYEGNSRDVETTPTYTEQKYIENVLKSAVNVIMSHAYRFNCEQEYANAIVQAAKDTAEYAIDYLVPKCNGYDTVFTPLSNLVEYFLKEEPSDYAEKYLRCYKIID